MSMGEAPLLKLYHTDVRLYNACDMLLGKHLFHRLKFGLEHSGHEIWTVLEGLAWKQCVLYLVPVWVAGHGHEDVRLAGCRQGFRVVHIRPLTLEFDGCLLHNKDTNIHSLHMVILSPCILCDGNHK